MAKHEETLSEKIKSIEKNANPKNMEIIYKELNSLASSETKLKKHLKEACKLINLIGTFLVKGEGLNTTESQLIFDTFCDMDFMSILLKYSSFDYYEINLEIITTFSFLMINIKSKTYLYYFFSKNLLNKIINKDYSKYDEEFLSYYVNFLKSLSLRLDEVSVNLFYIEKTNNFPIIENVLKLYNHRDSMVRNVVRNIVLNILKINNPNIQDHFTELPSISYLANIACHLRDICIQINEEVSKKKITNLQYLYDDLIDEATYIDDLLNLNLNKINYIIINCMFYYFILPVICGALSETTNKISKKVAVFLIIFFFINMKNEAFKNCLFSLLFFEQLSQDLDYLLTYPQEKANYSFHPNNEKEPSFIQYISENYSSKFLLTIIQKDNIIYNKYKNNYPQLGTILQKCNGMYQKLMNKELLFIDVKEKIEMILNSFFNEEESNFMSQYHLNLSMSTGLGVGQYSKENTGEMYDICFLCYINPIFVDLKGIQRTDNSSYLNYKKNGIKEGLYNIIEKINDKDEDMILLINLLLFVVQQEDTNISSNLLRHVGLENIRQKIIVKESLTKKVLNIFTNKKQNDGSLLSELCLNNNNFNYNNEYFQIIEDHKNKLDNSITMPLNLSKLLLIQHNDNNNNSQEISNKFLLPFIYRLILLNIINLSFNKNNSFELKKESNSFDLIIKNVENIYKIILESINSMIKENGNYRDIGYKIFYKKWKYYNEKINNKETLELIKDYIMNTTFILLPEEHEKNEEEKYFSEIWRKESNIPNNIFENNLLLFMMIHDLREMLLINNGFFKNLNAENLIKNKFPLQNNESELNINNTYELQKLKTMKNFIQISVLYKCNEQQDFEEGELILLNKFSYFAKLIEEDKIKIKNKFNLNSIYLYQDNFNYIDNKENSIINFLIHENPPEINNENDKIDKLIYSVKFKDEKTKEEYTKYINDKCCSVKNDERMNFMSYLDKIYNSIKDNEEDF